MSPPQTDYDENLLASAPAATRAERQEGYNVDLLEEGAGPTERTSSAHGHALDRYSRGTLAATLDSPTSSEKPVPLLPKTRLPWWRTGAGIAGIVVVLMVIVGAVVGGAVGGTVGARRGNQNDLAGSSPDSSSSSSAIVPVLTSSKGIIGHDTSTPVPTYDASTPVPTSAGDTWTSLQYTPDGTSYAGVPSTSYPSGASDTGYTPPPSSYPPSGYSGTETATSSGVSGASLALKAAPFSGDGITEVQLPTSTANGGTRLI